MARIQRIELDLSGIHATDALHAYLQEALGFPPWYGRNWDAFWDAITGLVEMPENLVIRGWADLKASLPDDARQLQKCLSDMSREYPESAAQISYT